jgi:hypothetical protein
LDCSIESLIKFFKISPLNQLWPGSDNNVSWSGATLAGLKFIAQWAKKGFSMKSQIEIEKVLAEMLAKKSFPENFAFESRWIESAIEFGNRELLHYSHPLFSRNLGYTRIELDAVVLNFLSHASGEKEDEPGEANVWASLLKREELSVMIEQLRKNCSHAQAGKIREFVGQVIQENQKQRVTKLDRKYYLHDYIFEKWNKKNYWAIAMKALCEQFEVFLPPEFEKEWEGGW